MARIDGFGGLSIGLPWSEWKSLVDGTTSALRYVEVDHGNSIYTLIALDGDVAYLCEPAGSDLTEWTDTVKPGASAYSGPRRHSDGSLNVKQDPGDQNTDPKFDAATFTQSQSGKAWHDMPAPTANAGLTRIVMQVHGGEFGDTMRVAFRSDGTVPAFGPLDTTIADFGVVNIPLGTLNNGWSARVKEPDDIGTSKAIPSGLKVSIEYDAASATERKVAIDLEYQE